ncbi:uncharacterized protein UV8b_02163 [Ustilaginoidea virens]|uniref:Prion-inhibition and propagation HeLo domain-containing protein n=1 Tax=Ustilaginoidea virens TaxID=1159556 RepID=A0A8E5HM98_USTVR|nr:uncharacterized protein UV8b_02163 [Ustilaginoidea virens]QUC17922.1 hypothetical protein UV8b_02163 [Ustilaginoidea virens]
MAAELIGTTVGVIGFLGQLFDGCVKAYGYFTAAAHLDTDSQRLMCKVRIEEMRLVVWGREWGVAEGRLEAHLRGEQNPQLRRLAIQIMQELHETVTDFKKLQGRYGLCEDGDGGGGNAQANGHEPEMPSPAAAAATSPSPSLSKKGSSADETSRPGRFKTERGWRKEWGLRTRWVIADKDKFTTLLRDLKDFNDGLERLFPPSQLPSFQRAWTHRLLDSAQRDLAQLSLLETASSGTYPQLNASANLKRLRINLDSRPQSAFRPTLALKVPRSSLTINPPVATAPPAHRQQKQGDGGSGGSGGSGSRGTRPPTPPADLRRCQGHHDTAGDVVVEWVDYDRDAIEERVAHVRRMDDLARMMHSASRCHPDLHSIDCLGYTDDAANSRYGLVYKAPASSYSTLHALISSPDLKTPDLDDRIRLAHTLAVALWSLHSLDWLHKSLCSFNITFFPSAFCAAAHAPTATAALVPDVSNPYLIGFDASRPDTDTALSVVPKNPSIDSIHRHPASARGLPYCKAFDVYSLGLVLLEIGLWKVLQAYHRPQHSADRWRDKVVMAVLVPGLGSKVGKRYRETVEMCLQADEHMSNAEAAKIMGRVVSTLESIRV